MKWKAIITWEEQGLKIFPSINEAMLHRERELHMLSTVPASERISRMSILVSAPEAYRRCLHPRARYSRPLDLLGSLRALKLRPWNLVALANVDQDD